jgi:hypothetical protein
MARNGVRGFIDKRKVKGAIASEQYVSGPNAEHLTPADVPLTEEGELATPTPTRLSTGHGRPFQKGNKAGRGRKPKLMMLGVDLQYLDIKDERYRSALRRAEVYLRIRSRQLCAMFGYASAGVNSVCGTGALALAASRYAYQKASEATGDPKMFSVYMKMFMDLSNMHRQSELAAYELCAKEHGIASKKRSVEAVPWLTQGVSDEEGEKEIKEEDDAGYISRLGGSADFSGVNDFGAVAPGKVCTGRIDAGGNTDGDNDGDGVDVCGVVSDIDGG